MTKTPAAVSVDTVGDRIAIVQQNATLVALLVLAHADGNWLVGVE